MIMIEIREYQEEDGKSPFHDWLMTLDRPVRARVRTKLDRVARGNFGDCVYLGAGLHELRLDFGPGYRVYFGKVSDAVVMLIGGGDKSTQVKDIKRARAIWQEWQDSFGGVVHEISAI